MKEINVVAAAIFSDGRVLAAQRPASPDAFKSMKWEFPGGKIEPGESPEQAIVREIGEELDCSVIPVSVIATITHDYPTFRLHMTLFRCSLAQGSRPHCLEHNALRWLRPAELASLDWAAADAKLLPYI